MAQLADRAGMMVSPRPRAKLGDKMTKRPVCAGPYRIVEWVAQDRIVFEKFDRYWNAAAVTIDRVTYLPIPTTPCGSRVRARLPADRARRLAISASCAVTHGCGSEPVARLPRALRQRHGQSPLSSARLRLTYPRSTDHQPVTFVVRSFRQPAGGARLTTTRRLSAAGARSCAKALVAPARRAPGRQSADRRSAHLHRAGDQAMAGGPASTLRSPSWKPTCSTAHQQLRGVAPDLEQRARAPSRHRSGRCDGLINYGKYCERSSTTFAPRAQTTDVAERKRLYPGARSICRRGYLFSIT
jgi:hypothetical protein